MSRWDRAERASLFVTALRQVQIFAGLAPLRMNSPFNAPRREGTRE
jgi:hypothetical protein